MNVRRIVQLVLFGVVVATVGLLLRPKQQDPAASTPQVSESTAISYTAYYFHGDRRCDTCRSIESQAEAAVRSGFANELAAGTLEWQAVNTDLPENAHFSEDFELTHSTVVLVEREGNETKRFAALDRVWELVHEEDGIRTYVQDELGAWLRAES
jgi:hypothetical protein